MLVSHWGTRKLSKGFRNRGKRQKCPRSLGIPKIGWKRPLNLMLDPGLCGPLEFFHAGTIPEGASHFSAGVLLSWLHEWAQLLLREPWNALNGTQSTLEDHGQDFFLLCDKMKFEVWSSIGQRNSEGFRIMWTWVRIQASCFAAWVITGKSLPFFLILNFSSVLWLGIIF